jgi:C_GCAxxG_C_C family probable redox protein
MNKDLEALDLFNNGFSCSQAVVATYCEQYGLDTEMALKISSGFGGGMGRLGETCGAVSGALMLIGLKYGKVLKDDNLSKEKTYELVQEFSKRFIARNKFIRCKELLGVDLITGDKSIVAERVKTVCPKMVRDASEIIEELLEMK